VHPFTDDQIIALVDQYMHGSDHPDQIGYREQVKEREFADRKVFLTRLKNIAKLGGFQNKRVLDVGCGFGWQAFVFSLLGNSVVGLDILPSMIEGMDTSIASMKQRGIQFDLTAIAGDICSPNLERSSFDAIYSNEAIEHVHNLQAMFSRCRELLKPGGKVFLLNDSNVLNSATRSETVEMWKLREYSWDWVAQLKKWRPVEHGNAKPFAVMREELVRAANPSIDDEAVSNIVQNTAGLIEPEITLIAQNYHSDMEFPKIGRYDRCRNPETGEYAERLLDPFQLASMLRSVGFAAHVRHAFRRFPLNALNGIRFRPIDNVLFELRGAFIVVGQLPG
jgi:SAM-dependent methyltransferase